MAPVDVHSLAQEGPMKMLLRVLIQVGGLVLALGLAAFWYGSVALS
jgi:hypothetical protein